MFRFVISAFGLSCALLLTACTGAPLMGLEVSDYRETFSWTGDEQLLFEILKAKDGAPLHFTELQTLGASNQFNATASATDPVGALNGSNARASIVGTASAQASPSFSLSSLELQQFTQGMINPVGPLVIQQLFEEGIDQRLLLMLFISELNDNGHSYFNSTQCDVAANPKDCDRPFFDFLDEIDRLVKKGKIVARSYVELAPIGTSLPWPSSTGVKDIAGIDSTKYSVERDPRDPTKAIVYAISESRLALCYYKNIHGRAVYWPILKGGDFGICTRDRVYASPNRFAEQWKNGIVVRSAYQIIEYLGQILSFQEHTASNNRCIKLADEPRTQRKCDAGDVLFQVNPTNDEATLVTTTYQGTHYSLGIGRCYPPGTYCDHSAEVLKIVNLLININKSAANIPQVPTVRIIQ